MILHQRHLRVRVRAILLLIAVLLSIHSWSQDSLMNLRPNIKFSPLHLLNSFSTVQFAYEQPIFKGLTAQVESGVVTARHPIFRFLKRDLGGWKFREDLRYYFKYKQKKPQANNGKAFYVACEFTQNYLYFYRFEYETVCDDPDCQSRTSVQSGPYKIKLSERGSGVKFGFTSFYHRLIFDLNFGACVHKLRWKFPEGSEPALRGTIGNPLELFIAKENDNRKFLPVLGFRIGYHLGKTRAIAK